MQLGAAGDDARERDSCGGANFERRLVDPPEQALHTARTRRGHEDPWQASAHHRVGAAVEQRVEQLPRALRRQLLERPQHVEIDVATAEQRHQMRNQARIQGLRARKRAADAFGVFGAQIRDRPQQRVRGERRAGRAVAS